MWQLLDELCAITGYTRKHALAMLSHPPAEPPVANQRGRPPSYGPAEVALLRMCWAATDGICSKRLWSDPLFTHHAWTAFEEAL